MKAETTVLDTKVTTKAMDMALALVLTVVVPLAVAVRNHPTLGAALDKNPRSPRIATVAATMRRAEAVVNSLLMVNNKTTKSLRTVNSLNTGTKSPHTASSRSMVTKSLHTVSNKNMAARNLPTASDKNMASRNRRMLGKIPMTNIVVGAARMKIVVAMEVVTMNLNSMEDSARKARLIAGTTKAAKSILTSREAMVVETTCTRTQNPVEVIMSNAARDARDARNMMEGMAAAKNMVNPTKVPMVAVGVIPKAKVEALVAVVVGALEPPRATVANRVAGMAVPTKTNRISMDEVATMVMEVVPEGTNKRKAMVVHAVTITMKPLVQSDSISTMKVTRVAAIISTSLSTKPFRAEFPFSMYITQKIPLLQLVDPSQM